MGTKRTRRSRNRTVIEQSPALTYYLVTGISPHNHVCGAVSPSVWRCEADPTIAPCVGTRPIEGAMGVLFMTEDEIREAWAAHGPALIAEARSFGFRPAAESWHAGAMTFGTALAPAVTAAWRRVFMAPYGRARISGQTTQVH